MSVVTRAVAAVKAFTAMSWSRSGSFFSLLLGSTETDYRAAANGGRTNAAVIACVRFVQRTLPEAPLAVYTRNRHGELKPAPDHGLQERLDAPNPFYSGLHLMAAVASDLMLSGNAYVVKVRSANRRVAQLWWVPSTLIEPAWPDDGSIFISHYDYRVEGQILRLAVEDVVHLRDAPDPQNLRKGLSPLGSLWREIVTDDEAANWTAATVRNGTPPGVVVTPGKDVMLTKESAEDIKAEFSQRFGGDRRGSALVLSAEANVQVLSFSPEQMNLREIRSIPEERITAVLGIPAAVVGLGTGLANTKVGATMKEMREQAYESCLIPLQRLIVAELQRQLVPDFGDPATLRVQFDLSQVRVLQDDQNALHERARADLLAGLLSLNEARQMIGTDPVTGPEGDVRYLPSTITVTPLDRLIPPDPPVITDVPQNALPAPSGAADMPAPKGREWALAGARNGHANGKASAVATPDDPGPALVLSEHDLDSLALVTPDDADKAADIWRRIAAEGLSGLIDAGPEPEGE